METITFETAKRLNEGGFLDNFDTEYIYKNLLTRGFHLKDTEEFDFEEGDIKTLTLDEASFLIPDTLKIKFRVDSKKIDTYNLNLCKYVGLWNIQYLHSHGNDILIEFKRKKTLLDAMETMLNYLIENNLLPNKEKCQ